MRIEFRAKIKTHSVGDLSYLERTEICFLGAILVRMDLHSIPPYHFIRHLHIATKGNAEGFLHFVRTDMPRKTTHVFLSRYDNSEFGRTVEPRSFTSNCFNMNGSARPGLLARASQTRMRHSCRNGAKKPFIIHAPYCKCKKIIQSINRSKHPMVNCLTEILNFGVVLSLML